ncbi:hypothetical protein C7967_106144 [Thalassospira sp. 11-3]|nr:hypothetical protein C7967_106144 [Thalassospira sp. 11-3]
MVFEARAIPGTGFFLESARLHHVPLMDSCSSRVWLCRVLSDMKIDARCRFQAWPQGADGVHFGKKDVETVGVAA